MASLDSHEIVSPPPQPKPTIEQLRHVVNNYPIIDNHAHNLLLPTHIDTVPFESITSEAQGRALRDTFKGLAHLRAARQLRQLYECPDDADWEEVLEQRTEWLRTSPEKLVQRCFQGTYALLMDDGFGETEEVHPYSWHDRYTQAPTKRIIRIETVAERLMESILRGASEIDLEEANYLTDIWVTFTEEFEREIQENIQDSNVAGFKSIICYRTGLDVEPDYEQAARDVGTPFERYVERSVRKRKFRIKRKALNDYLVLRTLEILSERLPRDAAFSKPIQFHTGLGDNDISLLQSNPAYLQPLIENYSRVPFVLLHSAYPYTREAGYLATVYKHVYLDVGEVFPMVSRDGQMAILRHCLELVPGSKLLYSTDGHYFPETYWLANKQFREVWLDLLVEYVTKEDITPHQAIALSKDILFNNSNNVYALNYQVDFKDMSEIAPKSLAWHPPQADSSYQPPLFPPPPKAPQVYDVRVFDEFLKLNPGVKFVYVEWLDFMATIRARVIPIKEFGRMIRAGERVGISQGNTGTLQNDCITPVVNPVGQIYVEPDLRTLRRTHKKDPLPSATVLCFWRDDSGKPIRQCPRGNLETLINDLQFNHGTTLLFGFEIEVTFLSRNPDNKDNPYTPLTQTHAWGTLTPEQWLQLPLLAEIATSLEEIGIDIQQFHAESGAGQYEFVLPPLPPLFAVDTLIQARQVVAQIAATHNLRATLHPQPFPGIGTAAHAHISLNPPEEDLQFFVGGVLKHLPAICAFTMPESASYGRVVDDHWTGGTWVAWGTQNRETPLRRVKDGRWEIRCLDGLANMYLALGAVLAAGLLGLKEGGLEFPAKDIPVNPSTLSAEQRIPYGIVEKMPLGVDEALERLEKDDVLREMLAEGLVKDFVAMKRSEQKMLGEMEDGEKTVWLIERY
ncbi:developmental protein-like protein fluG [Lindgomyces ingoldianus]|uniref:Developmental protein-like protein fluG n=1 Tax=Lindgomyces ingoldianus TaxID=673940 RepID=A0ACB6QKV9_9PLEO|nr:developmental protein-like protein fluG [Lindgomyces ingoldianus]KAF2466776.1 developmental protein-like protein fluG [Lindgomyces ingoldianus]